MADTLALRLGGLIRDTRRAQGLRLVDLSRLSGVALATLSDLENGTRDTRLSSYQRVFDALGIDAATLSPAPGTDDGTKGYDLGEAL
ncbi:helix-turn-helix domain-containing protein [Paracoccus laeviglucosivorans]|uniref:Helix-turn-helix domain-containing protein n=1 Tax=Paracoccus laeviglucosivorans TaxID=1197861 RepID=A0A521FC43_9RHOB|nr:helix-turn-helix domain-containing protein [Paracoccus laeviglucosivorans]SMO93733.1 Helix-turn-helix domain-containing protein [Paracoccus laeviglucosivorans]